MPACLQVLLLSSFEVGLTSLTATAVQLITTTPAFKGYMMSNGMVRLQSHHRPKNAWFKSLLAFALEGTTYPVPGCPAATCPAVRCPVQAKSVCCCWHARAYSMECCLQLLSWW